MTYDSIHVPIKYLDSIEQKEHILLLYEDPEYARIIECRFLKNGLSMGENCLYISGEDSASVVVKFLTYGIPLQFFQNGKIKIIQVSETCGTEEEMMTKCRNDVKSILDSLIPPYRIAGRIVPNVSNIEGISTQMIIEKETHSDFENMRGSVMCIYDITKIESTKRKLWIRELQENHHSVIYVPKLGQGGVISLG